MIRISLATVKQVGGERVRCPHRSRRAHRFAVRYALELIVRARMLEALQPVLRRPERRP